MSIVSVSRRLTRAGVVVWLLTTVVLLYANKLLAQTTTFTIRAG